MEFSLPDSGEDGEYHGAGFVEVSKIFAAQHSFSFGMISLEGLQECQVPYTLSNFQRNKKPHVSKII